MRAGIGDWVLAALVGAMIVMIVVPLSPWIMDLMIALNLAASIAIFCLAIFIRRPLDFSVFPTVLLFATLFRLALNISSTRLILTRADAGRIISGFGGFIVGNDILVGAIVFIVIALVLFMVITRGAERVAEVSARFSLDALPGMQLAIESDGRAGEVSGRELARRRSALLARSHYFGALDGAMKFVRGDAVAAIVIALINVTGGIAIGMLRHDLSMMDALNRYGRLTVGDGLVCMIPALLISTAAGILITRVSHADADRRLGAQLGEQLSADPIALVAAAVMMPAIGLVPGMPMWPFALMTVLLLSIVAVTAIRRRRAEPAPRTAGQPVLTLDTLQARIDALTDTHPVLVRETIPARISLLELHRLLLRLNDEGIDLKRLEDILVATALGPEISDIDERHADIRDRLSVAATVPADPAAPLSVAVVDDELSAVLEGALSRSRDERTILLPQDLAADIRKSFCDKLGPVPRPVVLTSRTLRRPLFLFLKDDIADLRVIAHSELRAAVDLDITARVGI